MANYLIEGNIDFYKELSKLEDDENIDTSSICLITNELLKENSVTLECKHSFNYIPLYNDVLNQKKKYNNMERCSLKCRQIRCPYCRNVQSKLLPYCEIEGILKIHGVNYYNEKDELTQEYKNYRVNNDYTKGTCSFISITKNSEGQTNEQLCSNQYVKMLSFDSKYYCPQHRLSVLKTYLAEKKQKEKEDKKKSKEIAKLKLKEEKKNEKELAKQEKKNMIIVEENKNILFCEEVIKVGKNKGKMCSQKQCEGSNLCKRHYNLHSKKMLNTSLIVEK